MPATPTPMPDPKDYLRVDAYLRDMTSAVALDAAFRLGLVDHLLRGPASAAELGRQFHLDAQGAQILLSLLAANEVVAWQGPGVALTPAFRAVLPYRELLRAKLDFARLVAPDFLELLPQLLTQPQQFFERARLFRLFDYGRCIELNDDNLRDTAAWVRFTTALTRHEAAACLQAHDFSGYRRHLDVGGNSGEFALQLCRQHAQLQSQVHDLPVVCEVGRRHLAEQPEANRIGFSLASPQREALPGGFDLVTFKSMLHDWPDDETRQFLAQAREALVPGGTLLIFERGPYQPHAAPVPYGLLPVLLFFRSYRPSSSYQHWLQELGFRDIQSQSLALDMPFHLITARR